MRILSNSLYRADVTTEISGQVAATIRAIRRNRGWNAAELGARSGLSPAIIENIENGRPRDGERTRDITVDELVAIADALGVQPAIMLPKLGGIINAARGGMPPEAIEAYLLGAVRMAARWLTEWERDHGAH